MTCRPAVAGRGKPSASTTRAVRSRQCGSGRGVLSPSRRAHRRRRGDETVRASVHVGEPQWFVNQALAAGVILGGFIATGGLEELGGAGRERDFREDSSEPCSMCEGTGRTECMCTRWSDDGEGCESCGFTGVSICPACRGGGRAVRVTLEIPVEPDPPAGGATGGSDRSGFRGASREGIGSPRAAAALVRAAIAEPPRAFEEPRAVVAEPRGVEGGPDDGEKSGGGEPDGGDPGASKDDEFYAQSGEAIRTLREDYPQLLAKQMSWGIYREDIGLVDDTNSFGHERGHVVASGIEEYKRCHKWLRTAAAVLFCKAEVNVSRIWSPLGSNGARSIRVRWSIKAKLRLLGDLTEDAHFDGISEYKLDKRGFIYQHTITDLDWDVAQMRDRIAALSNVLGQRVREPQLGSGQWFRDHAPTGWLR